MSSANDSAKIKYHQGLVHKDPHIRRVVRVRRYAFAWLVWGASALFVLFQFFLQLSSGEIVGGLMTSFSLSAFGGGVLASTYYYIYVALQTPAGMLIDRYGSRRLLTIGAIVCAFGCLLFGVSHVLVLAAFGRLMMGAGAACAFVGSLNLIGKWFPTRRFALMASIAETIGMLGTVIGGFFLAKTVTTLGWRDSMIGAAGLSAIIALLILLLVRDTPRKAVIAIPARPKGAFWHDLQAVVKNKVAWINGIYSGFMFSIITTFVALWAIPYMMLAHNISLMMATLACNMVFIGVAIGGPFMGWLDGRIRDRRYLLGGCSFVAAILLCVLIYIPMMSMSLVMVLMVVLGLFSSGYVLTFGIANEIVLPQRRASSMGFVNTLSVGSAPILQPLIGLILNLVSSHHGHGVRIYTIHDYQIALTIIPVIVLSAAYLVRYLPAKRVCKYRS